MKVGRNYKWSINYLVLGIMILALSALAQTEETPSTQYDNVKKRISKLDFSPPGTKFVKDDLTDLRAWAADPALIDKDMLKNAYISNPSNFKYLCITYQIISSPKCFNGMPIFALKPAMVYPTVSNRYFVKLETLIIKADEGEPCEVTLNHSTDELLMVAPMLNISNGYYYLDMDGVQKLGGILKGQNIKFRLEGFPQIREDSILDKPQKDSLLNGIAAYKALVESYQKDDNNNIQNVGAKE